MNRIKKNALFVIDGSYLLYRSFFAMRPLTTSTGVSTQATYGFCRAIKKLIDDFDLQKAIVVWDSKGKNFRHEIFQEYKGTRQKPPSDLFAQKDDIIRFLDAIKLSQISVDGYEADDVIAAMVYNHKAGQQVVVVSADKDMGQLLNGDILIYDPFKDHVVDKETFVKEQGFDCEKIPFYYSLVGDASDNIPGVAGIGKKTAQELVTQFSTLDDLYENLEKVSKDRTRKLLRDQKGNAFLSMKLFLLRPPELSITQTDLQFDKNNWVNAANLFQELEFRSLVQDIEKRFPRAVYTSQPVVTASASAVHDQQPGQASLFSQPPEAEKASWELVIVDDEQKLDALIEKIVQARCYALDTETTGPIPLRDQMVGISLAYDTQRAYYIPVGHDAGKQLDKAYVIDRLKPILEDKNIYSIMHNAKFDQLVLLSAGIAQHSINFDTLLGANLVRNEWQKINLKELSLFYLNQPMKKFKDVMGKKYKSFNQVPIEEGADYAAHDAIQTLKIKPLIAGALAKEPTLQKIFDQIEMPFYFVLFRIEEQGVYLDPEKIKQITIEVEKELVLLEQKIFGAIDNQQMQIADTFNLNSPKQIEQLLFDKLGLPVVKKSGKGSRSTDHEVLEELSRMHPVPAMIIKYRELTKLKSTYLEPLPGYINPQTGRVHTSYSQTMVSTGRLSSSEPNLQNIPTASGFGMRIREAFYAPEGSIFMSADYSQVELRILAHLAQDARLISIFAQDLDIHTQTAAQLFDVPIDQVTSEQRQLGKRINFSIIYGMSPFGLAKDLNIKQGDAKLYIEKYFAQYPGVALWMEKTVKDAVACGYVTTWQGRRRHIPELREKNRTLLDAGKRMAINSPVQGTQAEIMKMAMIRIDRLLIQQGLKARMILQIHDEMVVQLPLEEQDIVEKIIKTEMESVVDWEVPLKVTMRTGGNWAEITK